MGEFDGCGGDMNERRTYSKVIITLSIFDSLSLSYLKF